MNDTEVEPVNDDWTMSLFVPGAHVVDDPATIGGSDDPGELHSLRDGLRWLVGAEVPVDPDKAFSQWSKTLNGLVEAADAWIDLGSGKWQVDELTVGLTLSAKGHLLFIAEAGAEGSVQVKLTRRP